MLWRVLHCEQWDFGLKNWFKIDRFRYILIHFVFRPVKSLYCWGSKSSIWTKPIESWPKSGKQARWRQLIRKWEDKGWWLIKETSSSLSHRAEKFSNSDKRRGKETGGLDITERRWRDSSGMWRGKSAWDSLEDAESLGRSLILCSLRQNKRTTATLSDRTGKDS